MTDRKPLPSKAMTRVEITAVDPTILDRVSEEDVRQWMLAKLLQIRAAGVLARSFDLKTWFWDYRLNPEMSADFGLHGTGNCADGPTVAQAVAELRVKVASDPAAKAQKARSKSRELLKRAEELERQAEALKQPLTL